ncbi:MAG TPA: pitrilysin family protein [Arenimonas sp.]|nr:pitrilysin family protein [Arenimonas sp.]
MSLPRIRPLLLALALACSAPAFAADAPIALPKGVTAVTSVEGISEYRLPNGLRVLIFPDQTKPTVTVNITYNVGSRHEGYGETGMAHLLEHLLFKGTPKNPDIPGEFRKRGISFNGTTWYDRTNYFGSFAAGQDNLRFLLELEADRMVNSHVARTDLDTEMTVVRNEMEMGENNPFRVLMSRLGSMAYLWHNYGNSTIGARADIENMPIEALQDFYRRYYRPDNATVLVAGRVDTAETIALVAQAFGQLKKPATPVASTYTREPTQDGEREVVVRRVGDARVVGLSYHIPAGTHPDAAALQVLGEVLGDTPSGRLHKALVESRMAAGVYAWPMLLAEPGYFMVLAQMPRDGDDQALVDKLLPLVERAMETPISEDEVARAKTKLLKDTELLFNDANRTATALSEAIAAGDWRLFFVNRDRVEKVTRDDVIRVAQTYFKPENRTLGRFLPTDKPERAEIPEAPSVASLVDGYQGRAAIEQGEAFDPTPATIDARTELGTLANGTKLALLAKENRGDTVNFSLRFLFGSAEDVNGRSLAGGAVAEMLLRGTEKLSRDEISRRLDELKARLDVQGDAQSISVSGSTTREHLPALVDLVAEVLKSPRFDDAEFEQLRTQAITYLQAQMSEPNAVAGKAMNRHFEGHWPKGHPRYVETFEESLANYRALQLDAVKAFHREFYGAGFGEIAAVGDFDAAALKAQLARHFGDWTTAKPFVRVDDAFREQSAVTTRLETPDKANAILLMGSRFAMSDSHPDHAAMLVANHIFGGGGMKSRLADRVRQKEGLSYGAGSGYNAHGIDIKASHSLWAIAAPENIPKVETAFAEELQRFVDEGVSEAELKEAVDGILNMRTLGRAEDGNLVEQLRNNRYLERQMAGSGELEAKIKALTKAEVDAAIKRHVDPKAYALFAAGDFAKHQPKQ